MSASVKVVRAGLGSIPLLDAHAWRDDVLTQQRAGARVLTLHGRPHDGGVVVTAALEAPDGSVRITRTPLAIPVGYHELTTSWPALQCFERELHEQTGLRIAGHPWLKPIRYEGREQRDMNDHPFYRIEGKEVHEVAVGPVHAGVIEPGSFRFMCHGEQVLHLEVQLGYQHRGVERRLLEGDPRTLGPLVETIAGDTSIGHAWAYCAALESLAGVSPDDEAEAARAVALELERVAMHLASLSGLAADTGFLQGASTYGRLRTTAINTMMRLSGSRFGRGALRPGGVRMKLPEPLLRDVRANLRLLRDDLAIIDPCFLGAWTVQHRLRGIGVLTESHARSLDLVGPVARASGVRVDGREGRTAGAYAWVPIEPQVRTDGDCLGRARVRIAELHASLAWLDAMLELHPRWGAPPVPVGELLPRQLVLAAVEGFRGEVVHCLETDAAGRLSHYKVQDPSLRNWMGLAIAVRGAEISDFPICNKSFDLSYCGSDL